MRKLLLAAVLAAAVASTPAWCAPSYAVDLSGNTYFAEAVLAVVEGQTESSIIRLKTIAPDGGVREEILPIDVAPGSDRDPQVLFDAGTGELMVVWLRTEGGKSAISVASRPAPGLWLGPDELDIAGASPASFHVALDRLSRLQVIYELAPVGNDPPALLHRAYDVITLDPVGAPSYPFGEPSQRKPQSGPVTEGGTDEPGFTGGSAHSESTATKAPAPPAATDVPARKPGSTEYGLAGGCSVTVAYRISGLKAEIATRSGEAWNRGTLSVGSLADKEQVKDLVAEIAQRFCWP